MASDGDPRQTRLDLGEPGLDLLDRYANYHVLRRSWLSATTVSSFAYCHARPFVERVADAAGALGATAGMWEGAKAHERLQESLAAPTPILPGVLRDARRRDEFALAVELSLRDDRRHLRGMVDVAFTREGHTYLIELKNTQPAPHPHPRWAVPVWNEHAVQVQVYGLLARGLIGGPVHLAVAYLPDLDPDTARSRLAAEGDPQAAAVHLWQQALALPEEASAANDVDDLVRLFRRQEKQPLLPEASHDEPPRCARCRVHAWCPRRLDEPGSFQALNPRVLDPPRVPRA